jgi:phosphatidylglycerophosphatase A
LKTFNFLIATFFGIGKLPGAPGTWASIAAAFCFYFVLNQPLFFAAVLVGVYFLGVYTSGRLEEQMGEKDPSCAVIDEVLGMGIAMLFLKMQDRPFIIMAFILFRLFDIWKPYPIQKLEKLPGGWGIMTDDLMAGVYALFFIQAGKFFIEYILK